MINCLPQPKYIASLQVAVWGRRCLNPLIQPFTTCKTNAANQLPRRPSLADKDIQYTFIAGGGPGGQKINRTKSKAQLTHLPTGIVVTSQATRSGSQNYKIARQKLAEKIEYLEKGDESRLAKKHEKLMTKKRSREKKSKQKYRKLAKAKIGASSYPDDNSLPPKYEIKSAGSEENVTQKLAEDTESLSRRLKESHLENKTPGAE